MPEADFLLKVLIIALDAPASATSHKPSGPSATIRCRQSRHVCRFTPSSSAMAKSLYPWCASNTMRQRVTTCWGVDRGLAHASVARIAAPQIVDCPQNCGFAALIRQLNFVRSSAVATWRAKAFSIFCARSPSNRTYHPRFAEQQRGCGPMDGRMDVIHQPQKRTKKRPASAGQSLFPHDKYRMLPISALIVEPQNCGPVLNRKKGGRWHRQVRALTL
jgi:hypothetical protein